jgi:hypothetical protein
VATSRIAEGQTRSSLAGAYRQLRGVSITKAGVAGTRSEARHCEEKAMLD